MMTDEAMFLCSVTKFTTLLTGNWTAALVACPRARLERLDSDSSSPYHHHETRRPLEKVWGKEPHQGSLLNMYHRCTHLLAHNKLSCDMCWCNQLLQRRLQHHNQQPDRIWNNNHLHCQTWSNLSRASRLEFQHHHQRFAAARMHVCGFHRDWKASHCHPNLAMTAILAGSNPRACSHLQSKVCLVACCANLTIAIDSQTQSGAIHIHQILSDMTVDVAARKTRMKLTRHWLHQTEILLTTTSLFKERSALCDFINIKLRIKQRNNTFACSINSTKNATIHFRHMHPNRFWDSKSTFNRAHTQIPQTNKQNSTKWVPRCLATQKSWRRWNNTTWNDNPKDSTMNHTAIHTSQTRMNKIRKEHNHKSHKETTRSHPQTH